MRGSHLVAAAMLAGAMSGSALAAPTILQPTDEQSKDVFVYEFLAFLNFNNPAGGFAGLLAAGATGSGHDLRTFIQFDTTGLSIDANERATLNLYVVSTADAGFGVSPTPAFPTTIDVRKTGSAWDVNTVTWPTKPVAESTVLDSALVDGFGEWIRFDVTATVQEWIGGADNFGFELSQRDPVFNGGRVVTVFSSAFGQNRPFLQIEAIPEPASLAALGLLGVLGLRRRA